MTIKERIAEMNDEALLIDDHDNAIIGMASRCGGPSVVLYDPDIIIDNLHARGMSQEEAQEFFEFNIEGAYMGEHTPMFLTKFEFEETPVAKGDQAQRLLEAVAKWKQLYQPTCGESIYQTDKVNESCPELVEELMNIIGWETE